MDQQKQFETMATIQAYATQILNIPLADLRPTTAKYDYVERVTRMAELIKLLDTKS